MRTKHRLVDAAMVLLLPLLMAYSLIGEAFHELAGTLMILLDYFSVMFLFAMIGYGVTLLLMKKRNQSRLP